MVLEAVSMITSMIRSLCWAQDCDISISNVLELPQFCATPLKYPQIWKEINHWQFITQLHILSEIFGFQSW